MVYAKKRVVHSGRTESYSAVFGGWIVHPDAHYPIKCGTTASLGNCWVASPDVSGKKTDSLRFGKVRVGAR